MNESDLPSIRDSLRETRKLIARCAVLLWQQLETLQHGEQDKETQQYYQRYFGKDTPVAGLAKLVSLHKAALELEAECKEREARDALSQPAPLSEHDVALLADYVDRYRAVRKADES